MTDETTTQPQGSPAPAAPEAAPAAQAQPATPAPADDVESIISRRLAEWEEQRIKPLQREISTRDEEIKRLKTASMSEDERAQLEIEEQERERQQFETERWLFQKAKEHPTVAEVLEKFLSLDDPDEQFNLLVQAMTPSTPAPAAPAQPEPETQVADIDRNNPAPTSVSSGGNLNVNEMTKEMRERILRTAVWERA